ncbi:MAG TPA: zf-HC2 domain-containing protein [Gammaproteobacteria bacterium]
MTRHVSDHELAAALLPWLVNGTLAGDERERVERHVRQCLACRAELAEQTRVAALVRRQPVVPLAPDANFERLRSRLDRASPPGTSRRTLWALAAAVVIAVGLPLAAGLVGTEPDGGATYRTLSDAAGSGELIDVIFADGVREAEMRALLDELDAEIVAGPSRNLGRYTLRLPASADAGTVVRRLLDDPRIRFAGQTFATPAAAAPANREAER